MRSIASKNEKRAIIGYGPKPAAKFNPGQTRIPAGRPGGGRWGNGPSGGGSTGTDFGSGYGSGDDGLGGGADSGSGDGPGIGIDLATPADTATSQAEPVDPQSSDNPDPELVNRRGPATPVTIGGRTYITNPQVAGELQAAALRSSQALETLRSQDPEWRPTPSLIDPNSATGALSQYRSQAQEAEARLQVLERGNLPLGFRNQTEYDVFGREITTGLRGAGYTDTEVYMRGSSVTGRNFENGSHFDSAYRSDLDVAIASESMMAKAEQLNIRMSNQGARTAPLTQTQLEALGLGDIAQSLAGRVNRDVTFMLYRSEMDIARRGPYVTVP